MATQDKVFERVAAIVDAISGVGCSDLDQSTDLLDLGLDSLMFVRIGRRIESEFSVSLTMKAFYDEFSVVGRLCEYLVDNGKPVESPTQLSSAGVDRPPEDVTTTVVAKSALLNSVSDVMSPSRTAFAGSVSSADSDQIDQVMIAHLQLMDRYLSSVLEEGASPSKPAIQSLTVDSGSSDLSASTPEADALAIRQKFSGLELEGQPLTPQQKAFIGELSQRLSIRCAGSKALAETGKRRHADWKYSLQYKSDLKALRFPIVFNEARGAGFSDIDGNEYVDIAMGMGTHFFGHAPEFVDRAIREHMNKGAALGPQSPLASVVADKLCQLTGHERAAFFVTGSDAVMLALRIVRAATARKKIVMFAGAYHGICSDVLAAQGERGSVAIAPGIPDGFVEDLIVLDYDAPETLETIIELSPQLAGVLVEPVQSRNPAIQPQRFLRQLRAICTDTGIPLIFDEMVNGFRQAPGGMQEWFGVRSDISTYGKIIGGGFPLSVVAGNESLMAWVDGGVWSFDDQSAPSLQSTYTGGTHNKHPLAMAAANAVLDHIDQHPEVYASVHDRMNSLADRISVFFETQAVPLRFTYFGSQFKFESFASTLEQELFFYLLLEQGIYTWELHVANLSTAHGERECNQIYDAVVAAVTALREGGFEFRAEKLRRQYLPMSSVQRRLYAITQRDGAERPYHLAGVWKLRGELDAQRLEDCIHQVILRHESLRTGFTVVDGEFYQRIVTEPRFSLDHLPRGEDSPEALLEHYIQPFPLRTPPLIRVGIAREQAETHLLLIDVHHLAADGLSMNIVLQEILALYDGLLLSPVISQARHVHAAVSDYLLKPQCQEDRQYWQTVLSPFVAEQAEFDLSPDYPRPFVNSFRGERLYAEVDSTLLGRLTAFSRRHRVSNFGVLLAVFAGWIYQYLRRDRFVVGIPSAGRPGESDDQAVGMFVNTLALPIQVDMDAGLPDFVRSVRDILYSAQEHADYPFDALVRDLGIATDAARNPLFDVMFSYENAKSRELMTASLSGETLAQYEGAGMFDVSFDLIEVADAVLVNCAFSLDLFTKATMQARLDTFMSLLTDLLAAEDQSVQSWLSASLASAAVATLPDALLTPEPVSAMGSEQTLWHLWLEQVNATPDAIALIDGISGPLSFQDAHVRIVRIANGLYFEQGVARGDAVMVTLDPSNDWALAALAIVSIGAIYVPVPIDTPEGRRAVIGEQVNAKCAVASSDITRCERVPCVGLKALEDDGARHTEIPTGPGADDPAYVIFTSGSTGVPKGVVVPHKGICNAVTWRIEAYGLSATDSTLHLPSLAVDGSILDMFSTLLAGGSLIIPPADTKRQPDQVAELIAQHSVSNFLITPSLYRVYLETIPQSLAALRFVTLAGEAVPKDLVDRHYRVASGTLLWNEYGPTECSVVSSAGILTPGLDRVTIGRPITGIGFAITDDQGRGMPRGVWGRLWLTGVGLAQGYINEPALTAQRFISLAEFGGARFYDTGDVVRLLETGELEFRGRIDQQVKINGYRVELEDVEAGIRSGLEMSEVAVAAVPGSSGLALVAWVVADRVPENWRQRLSRYLQPWMIPSAISCIESLPTLPGGKLDRKLLATMAPPLLRPSSRSTADVQESAALSVLMTALSELLGRSLLATDNYFELGGDSVQAILLSSRLRDQGWLLDVNSLFADPSVVGISRQMRCIDDTSTTQTDDPPAQLSPIQSWFFEHCRGDHNRFVQSALVAIPEQLSGTELKWLLLRWMEQQPVFDQSLPVIAQALGHAAHTTSHSQWVGLTEVEGELNSGAALAHARQQIDLVRGRLIQLVTSAQQKGRILVVIHHLFVDSVSWLLMLEQLQQLWQAEKSGRTPPSIHAQGLARLSAELRAERALKLAEQERNYWHSRPSVQRQWPWSEPLVDCPRLSRTVRFGRDAEDYLTGQGHAVYQTRGEELLLSWLMAGLNTSGDKGAMHLQLESNGRNNRYLTTDYSQSCGWMTSSFPFYINAISTSFDKFSSTVTVIKDSLRRVPEQGLGYGILRYLVRDPMLLDEPAPTLAFNYLGRLRSTLGEDAFAIAELMPDNDLAAALGLATEVDVIAWLDNDGLVVEFNHPAIPEAEQFFTDVIERLRAGLQQIIAYVDQGNSVPAGPVDFVAANWSLAAYQDMLGQLPFDGMTIEQMYPLSPMQSGLFYHARVHPDDTTYVEQTDFRLSGIDIQNLKRAFERLPLQFTMLRAGFVAHAGNSAALIHATAPMSVRCLNIDDLPGGDSRDKIKNSCLEEKNTPFDVAVPPLMRVVLIDCTADVGSEQPTVHVIWTHHHIIMDGWCVQTLFSCLLKNTQAQALHPSSDREVMDRYNRHLMLRDEAAGKRYWREQLLGFELSTGVPAWPRYTSTEMPAVVREIAVHTAFIPEKNVSQARSWAAQHHTSLAIACRLAWALLLRTHSGQTDVLFGTVVSGRPAQISGIDDAVGLFINTVPVRISLDKCVTTGDAIRELTVKANASRAFEDLPLADIQACVDPVFEGSSLFDNVFVFENYPMDEALRGSGKGGEFQAYGVMVSDIRSSEHTEFPLVAVLEPSLKGLSLEIQYDRTLYSETQIDHLSAHYVELLAALAGQVSQPITALPRGSGESLEWLVQEWNNTAAAYDKSANLSRLIARSVQAFPDRVAVVDGQGDLTYQALWRQASIVAEAIAAQPGLGAGSGIALWLPRDRRAVVGMLAALLAGCHYVPLDPIYPDDRLRFIVEDSGAGLLLLSEDMPVFNSAIASLNLDQMPFDDLALQGTPEVRDYVDVDPHALAYVIYTSGSTGKPKGCGITHANLVRLFANDRLDFDFSEHDVWVAAHSLCFDFSVWEIYGALVFGGRVVVPDFDSVRDVDRFCALIEQHGVTVLNQTPSAFYRLADRAIAKGQSALQRLRMVIFGGDTLVASRLTEFAQTFGLDRIRLINMYGITETTVHVTYAELAQTDLRPTSEGSYTGRPLPETQVWIVDQDGQLLPPGIAGEIVVSGSGVCPGYLNREQLTAERFRPILGLEGGRQYWTGDRGMIVPGWGLIHLGRIDQQVQIRGFRVECGEVASRYERHPSVEQAIVRPMEGPYGMELVAYLVGKEQAAPQAWSAYLDDQLPRYMHASHHIWLSAIPLTPNGKVDYRLLPLPEDGAARLAENDASEGVVANIISAWREVLSTPSVNLDSDFFALGGHSLKALALSDLLKDKYGLALDIAEIFECSTPRSQAEICREITLTSDDELPLDILDGLSDEELEAVIALVSEDT